MKLSVIGTGYVGLVSGACFAEKGHDVICVDIRQDIVDRINKGIPTIHEPGLGELLKNNVGRRLRATTSIAEAVHGSDISFLCVGTPSREDGGIDLGHIEKASRDIGSAIRDKEGRHVVVVKSTVVPGSCMDVVARAVSESSGKMFPAGFGVCSNPEFLREGNAVPDSMDPDRIVIGAEDEESRRLLSSVYEGRFSGALIQTNTRTAEMIKYANNSLLSTLISFSNEISDICEKVEGVDSVAVLEAVTMDGRINPRKADGSLSNPQIISYLRPGCGYGGSCFPKDVAALISFAREKGHEPALLESVTAINRKRPALVIERLKAAKGSLRGLKIAVLGTAFKPDTDDIRESPALRLIGLLLEEGAKVHATDPQALGNTKRIFGDRISYSEEPRDALKGADAAVLVTKWRAFASIKPEEFASLMKEPLIFDGRRLYGKDYSSRLRYMGIGKKD
jgi:UDPglucose 6-dehydrogenase